MKSILIAAFLLFCLLTGCDSRKAQLTTKTEPANPPTTTAAGADSPPGPPVFETFEAAPKLSLFPRIGDYRPEEDEGERLAYWRTYLQHLTKTSGVVAIPLPQAHAGKVFSLRSVAGLESLGYFAPLAVEPDTRYHLSVAVHADLPTGGSAGIGILEFDEFLWVGEQYTRTLASKHRVGAQKGLTLSGRHDWQQQTLTFTTGPRTRMIHLVLFREGTQDRKPVLFDDLRVEKAER